MNHAKAEEKTAVSVHRIAAMGDVELRLFMAKHRRPDGGYELPSDGWEKLSTDEREHLAERLKAQERDLALSPTACSRPLDLDALNARLCQVPADDSLSLRFESPNIERSDSSPSPIDYEVERTRRPKIAYSELINDGGRPLYHIDIIQDVYNNPDNHSEILRPWQESLAQIPPRPEGIFQRQLDRWQNFRKWQNDNRGLEDDDRGFPAYVQRQKETIPREFLRKEAAQLLAEIEADPLCLKSEWERLDWKRERQRRSCREHGCKGFHDYAKAVKRRLARHGFTHTFELNEDPRKQDALTTWVEYLNYEYWWLDKYLNNIQHLESDHEKAWQELVDMKILRRHETKESVRTDASLLECEREKEQSLRAVERAKAEADRIYNSTQKDSKRLSIPPAQRVSKLDVSSEKLRAAKQRLEQAQNRSNLIVQFIERTSDYDLAKRDSARHRVLVQWVLDQVPLIKAEMNASEVNKPRSPRGRRTKRKLATDEERPDRQMLKKFKLNRQEPSLASAGPSSKATETRPELLDIMSQGSQIENSAANCSDRIVSSVQETSPRPRRSARIAARQDAVKPDIHPPCSVTEQSRSAESTAISKKRKRRSQDIDRRVDAKSSVEATRKPRQRRRVQ